MSFGRERLQRRLAELERAAGTPGRYVVAFSGGLDSTVLLHALAAVAADSRIPVAAAHVDHGLHAESAAWSEHCSAIAAGLGVEFLVERVQVERDSGKGLEAAARDARYAALGRLLGPGDWLLSAHHQDDQAETVLLNLLRGSGAMGLAGIARARRLGPGWLVRPLLDVPREDLEAYASGQGLAYIADPANRDLQFDRNYLRHEILPRLAERWPEAAARIRHSGTLASEAANLLAELAEIDRAAVAGHPDRLSIDELTRLPGERQRNLLRHVLAELGVPLPGFAQLEEILTTLVAARDDAQPLVSWPGGEARRYRGRLYLLAADGSAPPAEGRQPVSGERVRLPAGLGELVFEAGAPRGLSDAVLGRGLELGFRVGGEELKVEKQEHTKKLKKLLQEAGVFPWMRDRLPLVYAGGELVAVADLWLAADAVAEPGTAIAWRNHPPFR